MGLNPDGRSHSRRRVNGHTLGKPPCLKGSAGCVLSLHYHGTHGRRNSVRVAKKCVAEQGWVRFVLSTWPPFYGLPRLACWHQSPLFCALRDFGQPLASEIIYWLAEVRGSPYQRTLSQSSRLGLWCGRRRRKLPNPREVACDQCTKVHRQQCEDTWNEAPAAFWRGNEQRTSIMGRMSCLHSRTSFLFKTEINALSLDTFLPNPIDAR